MNSLGRLASIAIIVIAVLQVVPRVAPWLLPPALAQDPIPYLDAITFEQSELNTIEVIHRFAPSVFMVSVTPGAALRERLAGTSRQTGTAMLGAPRESNFDVTGSGFLLALSGRTFLVTNYHVVLDALALGGVAPLEGGGIRIVFQSVVPNTSIVEFPVRVVYGDPSYDLALLELSEGRLPDLVAFELANSDFVQVGQKTIVIGNPYGLKSSVTTGIVSGLGRTAQSIGEVTVPMIQTDAAVNPGNSGGPLLNSRGQVIGVVTSYLRPVEQPLAGISFALPSNALRQWIETSVAAGRP